MAIPYHGAGGQGQPPQRYAGAGMNPSDVQTYKPPQVSPVPPQPPPMRIPSSPSPQPTSQQPVPMPPPVYSVPSVPVAPPSVITAPSVHQAPSSYDQSDVFDNLAVQAYHHAPSISHAGDAINTIGQGVGSLLAHAGQIPQYDPRSANARILNAEQTLQKD